MRDISYWGGHTHIVFIGDSLIRQLYYEFSKLLGDKSTQAIKMHTDMQYVNSDASLTVVSSLAVFHVREKINQVSITCIKLAPPRITMTADIFLQLFIETIHLLETVGHILFCKSDVTISS